MIPQVFKKKLRDSDSKLSILGKNLLLWGAIIGVPLLLFLFFHFIFSENYNREELFSKLSKGRSSERRAAAAHWVTELARLEQDKLHKNEFQNLRPRSEDILYVGRYLSELDAQEGSLRAWLVTLLGYAQEVSKPQAEELLLKEMNSLKDEEASQVQIFGVLSLARLSHPLSKSVPYLEEKSRSENSSLRAAASFALGQQLQLNAVETRSETAQRLKELLLDEDLEVRANAALALARQSDSTSIPAIIFFFQRLNNQKESASLSEREFALYGQVISASQFLLGNSEIKEALIKVSKEQKNLKLREAAMEALRRP